LDILVKRSKMIDFDHAEAGGSFILMIGLPSRNRWNA
jgi:hypothetical protein